MPEPAGDQQAKHVFHGSWNLGGVKLDTLPKGIREAELVAKHKLDVLSLQEVPRADAGWACSHEEGWTIHAFREDSSWRGAGICFRTREWTLMAKKATGRGVWCKLRRAEDGSCIWIGSAHLTQGCTVEQHASEVHEFIQQMPVLFSPVVVGIDANTPFAWVANEEGSEEAVGIETKGDNMLGVFFEKGLRLSPPPREQHRLPTCRPRKQDVQGRHIDVVGGLEGKAQGYGIIRDSHRFVGSDHDLVYQRVEIGKRASVYNGKPNTRPRQVRSELSIPSVINQHILQNMAREYTSPYKGMAYRDPLHVKIFFQTARRCNTSEAWKRALRERDKARRQWREERIAAATQGDWQAYRETAKRGSKGWEAHFAAEHDSKGVDPHCAIHQHFQRVYQGQAVPPFPYSLNLIPRSPDFTKDEVKDAINKGKKGKSTGEDGVSHELLLAIHRQPDGEERILAWFNRLLHGVEPIPKDWGRAVMIVLPKCAKPGTSQQLRPICLGSSANKVYARMLLHRARPVFQYSGTFQNMGAGRQTIDYVWILSRMMALEAEWKEGLWFLKLDIEKAFDSLHRGRFLSRLRSKMGCCEELRCWWDLFSHTEANLCTPWGESIIPMTSGIRQGSVESPQVFASVMDWILQDVISKHGWSYGSDAYEGLEFAESAFVDDCILWNGSKNKLEVRTQQLIDELGLWGLRVNPKKCLAYASPHARDKGHLKVGTLKVEMDSKLDVMGIPFRVGITPKEALQGIFAKVKSKF